MKNFLRIFVIMMFFISPLFSLTGEYIFYFQSVPDDSLVIGLNVYGTNVFDADMMPTNQYDYYSINMNTDTVDAITIIFDWFKDPSGWPELAYGLYRISINYYTKNAYFYFDLRDCYYGTPHPIEPPDGSDYVSPPLDMCFKYDFSTDKFYGERRIVRNDSIVVDYIGIDNGDTIGIWFVRPDFPNGGTACTECFNPKVYLTNEYGSYTNFGQLVLDDSLYVDSGDSVFIPIILTIRLCPSRINML